MEEDVTDMISVASGTSDIEDSRSHNFEDLADDKYQGLETSSNFNVLIGSNSGEAAQGGDSEAMLGSSITELAEYSSASAGMNPADLKLSSTGTAHADASASLTPLAEEGNKHLRHGANSQAAAPSRSSRSSGTAAASTGDLDASLFEADEYYEEELPGDPILDTVVQASSHSMSSNQVSSGRGGTRDAGVGHRERSGFDDENGFEATLEDRHSSKGSSGSSSSTSAPIQKASAKQASKAIGKSTGYGSEGIVTPKDAGGARSQVTKSTSVASEPRGSELSNSAKHGSSKGSLHVRDALGSGTQDQPEADDLASVARRQLMQHESQDPSLASGLAGSSGTPGSELSRPGRRLMQHNVVDSAKNASSSAKHASAEPPGKHQHSRSSAAPSHGHTHSNTRPEHEQERSGSKGHKNTHAGLHESSFECRWEGSEYEEAHPGLLTPQSNHTACRYSNLLLWNNQVRILCIHQKFMLAACAIPAAPVSPTLCTDPKASDTFENMQLNRICHDPPAPSWSLEAPNIQT